MHGGFRKLSECKVDLSVDGMLAAARYIWGGHIRPKAKNKEALLL